MDHTAQPRRPSASIRLSPGERTAPGAAELPAAGAKATGEDVFSHRILLVEDQPDVARATAMGLEFLGARVVIAETGAQALQQAPPLRPTLVLMDIDLPDMSGHEVGRRLRTLPELAAAVIVALTSWDTPEMRRRSAAAGFAEHVLKPLDLDALAALLQRTAPPR